MRRIISISQLGPKESTNRWATEWKAQETQFLKAPDNKIDWRPAARLFKQGCLALHSLHTVCALKLKCFISTKLGTFAIVFFCRIIFPWKKHTKNIKKKKKKRNDESKNNSKTAQNYKHLIRCFQSFFYLSPFVYCLLTLFGNARIAWTFICCTYKNTERIAHFVNRSSKTIVLLWLFRHTVVRYHVSVSFVFVLVAVLERSWYALQTIVPWFTLLGWFFLSTWTRA